MKVDLYAPKNMNSSVYAWGHRLPLKSVFTKLTVNEEEADLKIHIRV